jgi:N,N'-diacetylchitobiose transport system permease protein
MQVDVGPPITVKGDRAPGRAPDDPGSNREPAKRRRWEITPYVLILPAAAIIVAFLSYPLYQMFKLSVSELTLRELFSGAAPKFIGFANYTATLTDSFFWHVVLRTIVFTIVIVVLSLGISLAFALLMRRVSGWVRIAMTVAMILVWAMPTIVASQVFKWMIDSDFGVVNYLINLLPGVNFENHSWFESPSQGWIVIGGLVVWGAIPFLALTMYAGLTQVPQELVEAATIDGATPWQILRNVLLPILRPVLVIVTTLSVIWDFQIFNQIFVLRDQAPENDYWTLGTYAFEQSFRKSDYSGGAAISVITLVLLLGVMGFYVRHMVKIGEAD